MQQISYTQPLQFKLDIRLARLLGIHTQTRPVVINALWQYIKTHQLQDAHEREYINCDKYLEQVCFFLIRLTLEEEKLQFVFFYRYWSVRE